MVHVFSFGSNNTAQLRSRLSNPRLTTRPAELRGFVRVFCLHSERWGGGVASICPARALGAAAGVGGAASVAADDAAAAVSPAPAVLGSVVDLTAEELALLDTFEGNYRRVAVTLLVCGEELPALTYVAGKTGQPWTPGLRSDPSEAYLTAIHANLREHWPRQAEAGIEVRGYEEATGEAGRVTSTWRHPGVRRLGLAALCVEVSIRQARPQPWVMPATLGEFESKLAAVGIGSTEALAGAVADHAVLNARLEAAGQHPFDVETLAILRAFLI